MRPVFEVLAALWAAYAAVMLIWVLLRPKRGRGEDPPSGGEDPCPRTGSNSKGG